ncbi:MAG TPA: DUF72 domain-containing protein [Acidobacteriaceae bacterium]|nr:DUF72 domain-containing protein [Acidobacteriaceae bacterium]
MAPTKTHGAEIFVGTSGYSYPDWKGVVYPRSVKREVGGSTPELTYLSRYFNTCEINATFYRNFEPKIAVKWSDAIENPKFEFAIKANQVFTHAAGTTPNERKASTSVESLRYTPKDVEESRKFLDVLAERNRLLVVLFQFPVSFKFMAKGKEGEAVRLEGNWDHVADVLNAFQEYPKAIEFRHESWDDPWVLSALREHESAWVNIDEPRLGASLHSTDHVTAPLAYLRLHGRNYKKWFHSKNRDERYDYLYKADELEPIAASMKTMAKKVEKEPTRRQAKKIIAATNNHYKGQAAVNAVDLKRLLGMKDVAVPPEHAEAYPQLREAAKKSHR